MALALVEKTPKGRPCWFRGQGIGQAGGKKPVFKVIEITFDASYPTGGESLTAADCGLSSIIAMQAHVAAGFVFEYDLTNSKLIAFWVDTTTDGAAMAQVANTTNMATVVTRALVWGYE